MTKNDSSNRSGPEFTQFFQPVLDALKEKDGSARPKEVYDWIIENEGVSEEELEKTNKNGRSNFENRVAFARFYLTKAGYLDGRTRGVWALTQKGRDARIDRSKALSIFDEVHSRFRSGQTDSSLDDRNEVAPDDDTPIAQEGREASEYLNLSSIEQKLVEHLHAMSPDGFEQFCARILRSLGLENVVSRGGTGDAGIDGIGELLINRFLRIRVAFQCKKHNSNNAIGPEKVRDFRGAISGRVDRGIYIATTRLTKSAIEEAKRENVVPIEVLDITRLVDLLIDERIGVSETKALTIDDGFFEQYR